jgi:hypothetical protein
MDFTRVIAKINPIFIICTETSPYIEAENEPLYRTSMRAPYIIGAYMSPMSRHECVWGGGLGAAGGELIA